MSLPAIVGTRVDTIPWSEAYLTSDADLVVEWIERLSGWDQVMGEVIVGLEQLIAGNRSVLAPLSF